MPYIVDVSRPKFLTVRAEFVPLYRRKCRVTEIDPFVACRMLDCPCLQLAPISAHLDLPDPGMRTLGRRLLVESSGVPWCVIGIAQDDLPEDIEAVCNVFPTPCQIIAVVCFQDSFSY